MNITRTTTKRRFKNTALAACAVIATATMAAGDLAAQCRVGGGGSNYGYGQNYSGYGYGAVNSGYRSGYTNGRGYGTENYRNGYQNTRSNSGYRQTYGEVGRRSLSDQRPSLLFGLTYNSNRNSGFNSGIYSNRSSLGNGYYSNTRQPVSYHRGNRFGSGYGRGDLGHGGF